MSARPLRGLRFERQNGAAKPLPVVAIGPAVEYTHPGECSSNPDWPIYRYHVSPARNWKRVLFEPSDSPLVIKYSKVKKAARYPVHDFA